MKVSLNLAISPRARERYALAWALPVALLALAGSVSLCGSALRGLREYRQVRRDLAQLEQQEAETAQAEKDLRTDLEQPQYRALFRQTQFVNALIDRKRLAVTGLAESVAKLVPVSVRLTAMTMSQKEGEPAVRFTVSGASVEAVESFFINLEDSSDFKDPAILNQSIEEAGTAAGQVTITCTARYVGGEEL